MAEWTDERIVRVLAAFEGWCVLDMPTPRPRPSTRQGD